MTTRRWPGRSAERAASTVMDCKGFDDLALDLVYDDGPSSQHLDEARRHVEGCSRCTAMLASLQKTRALAEVPPLPVPAGLERSILDEVERRQREREATWWGRLDRAISYLASYAMRPQTAMGALALLMVGTSLFLLRARPAGSGAVRITEDGVPAYEAAKAPAAAASVAYAAPRADYAPPKRDEERERRPEPAKDTREQPRDSEASPATATPTPTATATAAAAVPPAAAPAASAAGPSAEGQEAAYAAAMEHYKARRFSDAVRAFDIVANGGGGNAALAALYAARATRYSAGCGAALSRLDAIASRYVGSSAATEATWEAAVCYREVGQVERARQLFGTLRRVAGYRDRVERELSALDGAPVTASDRPGGAPPAGAAAKPAATGDKKLSAGRRSSGSPRPAARAARPRAPRTAPPCRG